MNHIRFSPFRLATALMVSAASALPACVNKAYVGVESNQRALVFWNERKCLEYSPAAAEEVKEKITIRAGIRARGVSATANLDRQKEVELARVFEVSEILQFGHMALYRLCEARGNGDVKAAEFGNLYTTTLRSIDDLLMVQRGAVPPKLLQRVDDAAENLDKHESKKGNLQAQLGATAKRLADEFDALLQNKNWGHLRVELWRDAFAALIAEHFLPQFPRASSSGPIVDLESVLSNDAWKQFTQRVRDQATGDLEALREATLAAQESHAEVLAATRSVRAWVHLVDRNAAPKKGSVSNGKGGTTLPVRQVPPSK